MATREMIKIELLPEEQAAAAEVRISVRAGEAAIEEADRAEPHRHALDLALLPGANDRRPLLLDQTHHRTSPRPVGRTCATDWNTSNAPATARSTFSNPRAQTTRPATFHRPGNLRPANAARRQICTAHAPPSRPVACPGRATGRGRRRRRPRGARLEWLAATEDRMRSSLPHTLEVSIRNTCRFWVPGPNVSGRHLLWQPGSRGTEFPHAHVRPAIPAAARGAAVGFPRTRSVAALPSIPSKISCASQSCST